MPHPGHCLTRAIKDVFPRYRTMRGFRCERKAGWDTHGLPVEVEVCKELGIHSKEEIEAYGVEPFIHKCQESVWRYMQQWERLTERIGFWVDLEQAYVTYHQSYVESVWWSLKNLFDRGLLYQGHKIVWWWAQGGRRSARAKLARAIAKWPIRACTSSFRSSLTIEPKAWPRRQDQPARLDHYALDAAQQSVRGRPSGARIFDRRRRCRDRRSHDLSRGAGRDDRAKAGPRAARRVDTSRVPTLSACAIGRRLTYYHKSLGDKQGSTA